MKHIARHSTIAAVLIYRRELPLMIAAFIDPGKFRADGKSNRQPEYDPVTDRYSHVIVDELLPKLYAEYRLVAKGYDVNYAWGMGVHSHDMGGAMLPEMMRWLWRDHPVSVDPHDTVERSFRK
jgi:hypothetical protein